MGKEINRSETAPGIIQGMMDKMKRIVVKIGTRVIDDEKTHFNRPVMESLVKEIAALKSNGIEVILVSSGAVGAGLRALGMSRRPPSIHLRQAYAAIGQGRLMNLYSELFGQYGIITAQVLLTRTDLDRRDSYLNARETLQHLLTIGVLPIINENDTVSTDELRFGDNDYLAALLAGKMDAGLIILLTTVDGLYRTFENGKGGELIETIDDNFEEASSLVKDKADPLSMGGMRSKLEAGKSASSRGVLAVIANGRKIGIIDGLFSGKGKGTWIIPSKKRMAAWKYYLAFAKRPCGGRIIVDDGAVEALRRKGKSLLASGVRAVSGSFQIKDLVRIDDLQGVEFARGLVNYNSDELRQVLGRSSQEIGEILNGRKAIEVVHRDNLVVLE
ncbi:MAG: glutamate 5-kinase [Candidatus Omnitrophota bacterium]